MTTQFKKFPADLTEPYTKISAGEAPEPSQWVYQQISDAILEQRLAPGTKLGEEQLGEIFDVGRPVVRRALAQLSFERVVEIKPNRGAFVACPTVEEARQVFEARRVLEEGIVRALMRSDTKHHLAKLRRHVEIEAECARKGERTRWIRLSGEFHLLIARAAGNDVLLGFLEDLVAQTSLILGLYGRSSNSVCCDDDHERIVQALAAGDEKKAVAEMLKHLRACEDTLAMEERADRGDLAAVFADAPRPASRRRR